jgi:hypothetical protein
MNMSSNDRVQRIIDATSEVENNEELARIVGEGLLQVAQAGRAAWEALFEFLDSADADTADEVMEFFSGWCNKRFEEEEDADAE